MDIINYIKTSNTYNNYNVNPRSQEYRNTITQYGLQDIMESLDYIINTFRKNNQNDNFKKFSKDGVNDLLSNNDINIDNDPDTRKYLNFLNIINNNDKDDYKKLMFLTEVMKGQMIKLFSNTNDVNNISEELDSIFTEIENLIKPIFTDTFKLFIESYAYQDDIFNIQYMCSEYIPDIINELTFYIVLEKGYIYFEDDITEEKIKNFKNICYFYISYYLKLIRNLWIYFIYYFIEFYFIILNDNDILDLLVNDNILLAIDNNIVENSLISIMLIYLKNFGIQTLFYLNEIDNSEYSGFIYENRYLKTDYEIQNKQYIDELIRINKNIKLEIIKEKIDFVLYLYNKDIYLNKSNSNLPKIEDHLVNVNYFIEYDIDDLTEILNKYDKYTRDTILDFYDIVLYNYTNQTGVDKLIKKYYNLFVENEEKLRNENDYINNIINLRNKIIKMTSIPNSENGFVKFNLENRNKLLQKINQYLLQNPQINFTNLDFDDIDIYDYENNNDFENDV